MRIRRSLAVLLFSVLVVGACGSGADSDDSPADTASTTEQTASTTTVALEDSAGITAATTGTSNAQNDEAEGDDPDETAAGELFSCTPTSADLVWVSAVTDWSSATTRHLEYKKIRTDTRRGIDELSSLTPVELTIAGPLDGGWELVWQNANTNLDGLGMGLPPEEAEAAEALIADIPKQRIQYQVDASGGYVGATNHEQIREDMNTAMEVLTQSELLPGIEQTAAFFDSMSDEQLAQLLTEPVQVYHSMAGLQLVLDAPIEFADELPNLLGGEPFPAITTIEVTNLVDDDGCVEITTHTTFDPELILPLLFESVAQAFGFEDPNEQEHAELEAMVESFQMENLIVGQFDTVSGYFYRVTATQHITSGTEERIDTDVITDVTPIAAD
ncbi:MAG: hypothetical protein GY939_23480 [Actinomycetia bacterium]|nr:hypothetical protein [Actinomycetes bacterium]